MAGAVKTNKLMIVDNNTKIFATLIDEASKDQINSIVNTYPFNKEKVRIMPDVHAGNNCVVGFTSTLNENHIDPNLVGSDIGCGMSIVKIGNKKELNIDFETLHKFIEQNLKTRSLRDYSIKGFTRLHDSFFVSALSRLMLLKSNLSDTEINKCLDTLGTLGGGNHFIEIGCNANDDIFIVVHSGSRRLGGTINKYYVEQNKTLHNNEYVTKMNDGINELKEQNLHHNIPEFIQNYKQNNTPNSPYLHRDLIDNYLFDMGIGVEFAKLNREYILKAILLSLGIDDKRIEHCIHNYIDADKILRKGACSAKKDQLVVIPINMKDGIIYGYGKGNADWNMSAPHGAGRILSRSQAKKQLSLQDLTETMQGITTFSLSQEIVDESPRAYKSMEDILPLLTDTVTVVDIIKPIFNYKTKD